MSEKILDRQLKIWDL